MGEPRGSLWQELVDDEMIMTSPLQLWWYGDIGETQTYRMCMRKDDELNDVISHNEVLKTKLLLTPNLRCLPHPFWRNVMKNKGVTHFLHVWWNINEIKNWQVQNQGNNTINMHITCCISKYLLLEQCT
jgi:hypothetical protein